MMNIAELQGADLDGFAAQVCRIPGRIVSTHQGKYVERHFERTDENRTFSPSRHWAEAGPIIRAMRIAVIPVDDQWSAFTQEPGADEGKHWTGETPLIAAMRAAVGNKFGAEVPGFSQHS